MHGQPRSDIRCLKNLCGSQHISHNNISSSLFYKYGALGESGKTVANSVNPRLRGGVWLIAPYEWVRSSDSSIDFVPAFISKGYAPLDNV